MRTWLLAPDGVWGEVTDRLTGCDPDPARWAWHTLLAGISGTDTVEIAYATVLDRADLPTVHGNHADRWIANLIWSTLCTDHVDRVTVIRTTALTSQAWLDAVAAWAGRPSPDTPPVAWTDRRARWMLWAHSNHSGTSPLDGARLVVGAVRR